MRPKPLNPGTQKHAIARYLSRGKKLTAIGALSLCNCWRLAPRIKELKRARYRIRKQMIRLPNGKRVAEYFIPQANR